MHLPFKALERFGSKTMILMRRYGIFGMLSLSYSLLITRIFYRSCKLIRMPIDVRGKYHIDFGKRLVTGKYCRIECSYSSGSCKKLVFGDDVQINDRVHIDCVNSIVIGSNVTMASGIYIGDNKLTYIGKERVYESSSVVIGDSTWIGENAIILPGVRLGSNCVVGAGSVVTKSFGDNTIIVGNPGRRVQ